ncbi:hypothetical protein CRE_21237 [Caenorhabditis remanei]|uniref:Uncharacterized protein n=1 Tax=Caenorhabditis remanei TaxID=31234 RepID=E3MF11_CAERE|nr:hypothetical protein CRE_21237 [Caenorhabditis remanei]
MKLLGIVEILLIGFTTAVVSNLEPVKEQEDFIKELNKERRNFANKHKITGMEDLVWSSELQEVADAIDYKNLPLPEERKWRFTLVRKYTRYGIRDLQNAQIFYFPEKNKSVNDIGKSNKHCRGLEHINPLQNTIACAEKEGSLETDFKVICLLGPESRIIDLFQLCNGKADKKTVRADRLCPSLESLQYDQLYFISELNKARQENAKTKNVNNMHELTWSQEMHYKALSSIEKEKLPENRNFRIILIGSYKTGLKDLKMSEGSLTYTQISQKDLKDKKIKFYPNKEYLHPLQTDIACFPVKDSNATFCFLGPEAQSFEDIKNPPEQCKEEFEKDGDLCSRKPEIVTIPHNSETESTAPPPVSTNPPESAIQTPGTSESETESSPGTCALQPTTPVPRVSFTRFTTEKVTPEPPPRLPKELEDYEELDGDEYDEDFPTGEPPRYKRNSNFVPSCLFSVLLVLVSCF